MEEICHSREMEFLALTETRWSGMDKFVTDRGSTVIYSARDDNIRRGGVALLMGREASKAMSEWRPINDRMLLARFESKQCNLSVIVCYAPINDAADEIKDEFYEVLQESIDSIPNRDMIVCLGDFNAKVGNSNDGFESTMGCHGLGDMNENGMQFVSFCEANRLVIGGTMFMHKDIHKYTWTSPGGIYRNQIDHIAVSGANRNSL